MKIALKEARTAAACGEVPVGAVIVKDGTVISTGRNMTEALKDPTAHAEIVAIRRAAEELGGWRLPGCSMFVTLEPCPMCAGAIVWSRIEKLYIGARDPKSGACGSLFNIPQDERLNHFTEISCGMLEDECGSVLRSFFRRLRINRSEDRK